MRGERRRQRRVVSKARFAAYLASKGAYRGLGYVMLLAGICAGILLIGLICITIPLLGDPMSAAFCVLIAILGGFTRLSCLIARRALQHASAMQPLAPLTRRTAADLPARECLVRASEEPVRESETELLRVVPRGLDEHPEELLRPKDG